MAASSSLPAPRAWGLRARRIRALHDPQGSAFLVAMGSLAVLVLVYVVLANRPAWQVPLLRGFVVILATALPGLLYLRFVRVRLLPLTTEYVYNLHRLRLDSPGHLPEPPASSKFHDRWQADGGQAHRNGSDDIYRLKFQSQYGAWPRSQADQQTSCQGALLSVGVCTAVVGVTLCSVVWRPPTDPGASALHAGLGFGVLGAYFFVINALMRRYFQNDLRPAAYLAAAVRIITTLLLVLAVLQVLPHDRVADGRAQGVGFVVGIFPSVALQLLRRAVGRLTGWARGGLDPPYPLGQLDGMDVWTEARLLEVGIEDVQHLATANLVDLSLATRLPMQRVVDWVDQSLLLVHAALPRQDSQHGTTYQHLRDLGIRSASEVVGTVERLGLDLVRRAETWPAPDDPVLGCLVTGSETGTPGLLTRAVLIGGSLRDDPNLTLVRNWKRDGDPPDAGSPG